MLELKTAELARFLDLTILKGTVEFKSALLSVSKDGLAVRIMLEGRTFGFTGNLKGNTNDEPGYTVGFRDLSHLRQFISNFPDVIKVEQKKNKLHFSGEDLKSNYQLVETQYIKNVMSDEDYQKASTKIKAFQKAKITKEQVKQITDYFKAVGSEKVVLRGKGNKITVDLEKSENTIEASFSIKEKLDEFTVSFPPMISDILSVIGDDVIFYIQDKAPLGISYCTENIDFDYFIAPLKTKTSEKDASKNES